MKILFIHQNFPGQFRYLAPALISRGHQVIAISMNGIDLPGVDRRQYQPFHSSTPGIHPWLVDFETKIIRGEAVLHLISGMKANGYSPDLIIAHPGWGESLFVKDVWPNTRFVIYCEFFYHLHGGDINFDQEFSNQTIHTQASLLLKNLNNYLHFNIADAGISPTQWQRSTFPESFQKKIEVIHEGVDTELFRPNPNVSINFGGSFALSKQNEIITFISRNLEPYRGYHSFMRALPKILRARPNAHVLIVGGSGVGYGSAPPSDGTWKDIYLNEVRNDVDLSRIHFLGNVNYEIFTVVLQISTAHVYLTYPFVLGWSCIEAMSTGCAIVGSDTQPVREVINHNWNGVLVNMFSYDEISNQVIGLLENEAKRIFLGTNARKYAIENFDRQSICLPKQVAWIESFGKV